jgi:hypothetical protein
MQTLALVAGSVDTPSWEVLLTLTMIVSCLYNMWQMAKNTHLEIENKKLGKRCVDLTKLAEEDAGHIAILERTSDLAVAKAAEQIAARIRAEHEVEMYKQRALQRSSSQIVSDNISLVELIAEGPSGLIH